MKYFTIVLLVALLIVLVIDVAPTIFPERTPDSVDFEESAEKHNIDIVGTLDQNMEESCTFTYTSDSRMFNIKEGQLLCTITGAEVVTCAEEIPEGSFAPGHNIVDSPDVDEEGNIKHYIHPYPPEENDASRFDGDFILEDGSFMDGVYMVTVDIQLENKDCSCWTLFDYDNGWGQFYDPYLFGVQYLIKLCVLGESAANTEAADMIGFAFFSGYGECHDPDAPETQYDEYNPGNYSLAIRLEPGESKTVTLGFLVTRRWFDKVLPTPSGLFAVRIESDENLDRPAIYLGLDWPEGMGENE